MGTPDFAVPPFQKLLESNDHKVVAVFTAEPKASGRSLKQALTEVHKIALEYNIPTYTPATLKTKEILDCINSIEADIIVVVAYGFLIPKNILFSKKYGSINIHPSDLPKYRGASPIQRTIIDGNLESAVCIIQMDEGLDTGDIILQKKFPLGQRITLTSLQDQCSEIASDLLVEVLDGIDTLPRIKQGNEGMSYAHKLRKDEGKINWNEDAYILDCKIRGMNPWPGVYFEYKDKIIKILEADYSYQEHNLSPGTVINDELKVACGKGILVIKTVQQAGKSRLLSKEFLRGTPIKQGSCLG